jgi:hypothetical protein
MEKAVKNLMRIPVQKVCIQTMLKLAGLMMPTRSAQLTDKVPTTRSWLLEEAAVKLKSHTKLY